MLVISVYISFMELVDIESFDLTVAHDWDNVLYMAFTTCVVIASETI